VVGETALAMLCDAAMDPYHNPYRDQPPAAPLTRAGRLVECMLALVLTLLAVYLSR